jgi:predicted enzyme related to lactoylglutathione lyase
MSFLVLVFSGCLLAMGAEMSLTQVTVLVKDQDDALKFYTEKLGFEKRADMTGSGMRWLTVAPKGQKTPEIILLKADAAKAARVGQGTTWVIETDNCQGMYEAMQARGVKFVRPPEKLPWGIQAVLEDLYGNPYALIQPSPERP